MKFNVTLCSLRALALGLLSALPLQAQFTSLELPARIPIPAEVDLAGSFSLRLCVRLEQVPANLPLLAASKDWESGEPKDYTTNNSYGWGRESGALAGFALSVLPDGAWTWNAGDGKGRLDHRPEAADQGIADGRWHELGFALDREMGVVALYHDGRRVALHDLHGLGSLGAVGAALQLGKLAGLGIADVRFEAGVLQREVVQAEFIQRFGEKRRPIEPPAWDGRPLKVLAWNIWHGGRRKGRDEGVQRVVEVIQESGADLVLMQETYGSGPRISGRLGFDYYLRSKNLSILSRYPIRDVHRLFSAFHFGGASIELRPGLTLQAYSLWIHYLPSVGQELKDDASPEQMAAADAETRGREMDAILAELLPHLAATPSLPVIVGGDFNSGSHLDWTEAAAALDNHQGRVVPWPVSLSMERAGFQDSYRLAHPDPIAKPGLTWSPEFRESHQERIDYVYTRSDAWRVIDSRVLSSHERGWPSDHAAVLSTLALELPADEER